MSQTKQSKQRKTHQESSIYPLVKPFQRTFQKPIQCFPFEHPAVYESSQRSKAEGSQKHCCHEGDINTVYILWLSFSFCSVWIPYSNFTYHTDIEVSGVLFLAGALQGGALRLWKAIKARVPAQGAQSQPRSHTSLLVINHRFSDQCSQYWSSKTWRKWLKERIALTMGSQQQFSPKTSTKPWSWLLLLSRGQSGEPSMHIGTFVLSEQLAY